MAKVVVNGKETAKMQRASMVREKTAKGSSLKGKTNEVANQKKAKDKGSQDGKGKKIDNNQCSYCLTFGHWRPDCNKLKDNQKHNRVRQIEEVVDDGAQGSSHASTSGTTPSNVGLVSFASVIEKHALYYDVSCEDLTLHDTPTEQSSSHCLRVLSMDVLKQKLPDGCTVHGGLDTFDLT